MAPEQAESRHEDVGPASDTYALGCILYELVTRQPPFRDATERLLLKDEPASLSRHRLDVSRDLETICLKCLEKKPENRYSTAASLADDLGRWLRDEPVLARRLGPLGRIWRWCRRKPAISGMIAVLFMTLLVGITGIVSQWLKAEEARRDAESSKAQVEQLLSELLPSSPDAPQEMRYSQKIPSIDALLKAEAHYESLLGKSPDDTRARIVLTNVRGTLGALYALRGQMAEMDASYDRARDLWETLALRDRDNPEYRDWLATTYFWQSAAARSKGQVEQSLRSVLQAVALWHELAEEQPHNMTLLRKVADVALGFAHPRGPRTGSGRESASTRRGEDAYGESCSCGAGQHGLS